MSCNVQEAQRLLILEKELHRRNAASSLPVFLDYMQPTYDRQWFHTLIAKKCQQLMTGDLGKDRLMIFMPPQHGKALDINTPILTTKGWKTHGDLQIGDYVFGSDGKPRKVIANTGAYLWHCKQVNFASGISLIAAPEHEWQIWNDHDDHKGRVLEQVETQAIFSRRHRRAPFIQADAVIQGIESNLPIDPYILGLWLGDGLSRYGCLISGKEDAEYYRSLNIGEIREVQQRYFRIKVYGLSKQLTETGLKMHKHIPMAYLLSSEKSRWALLQGLMDTDGCVDKRGNCEFCQKDGELARNVYTLLRSLGIKARYKVYDAMLHGKKCGRKVRILFNPDSQQNIFRLPRKQDRLSNKTKADRADKKKFFITSIQDVNDRLVNCIQVEGGMYLAGIDLIPTHNSEVVSRKFPAFALGQNPRLKIVGASYSSDLAQQFSRSIQRTLDSNEYSEVFPKTMLNSKSVSGESKRGYIRNVDMFETVGYGGFYKAVGIGGALTGTPADIAIIDDPIKDAIEAASITYRNRVWSWYTDVLLTRLHNKSKVLLIQTRWHDDDLAGRLLKHEPDDWYVVSIPAIKENNDFAEDPRQIGEALWEEKHSAQELRKVEQRSPRTYSALYQQRPSIEGGNIVKRNWFGRISVSEFNKIHRKEPIIFFIDTAYTDNSDNDPTGIIATCKIGNELYITHGQKVLYEFPELIKFIPAYVQQHGYDNGSTIRIEPKANGLSVVQQLKVCTGLNIVKTPSPSESKETRLTASSPSVESGRVILVEGAWNEQFIDEVCGFPAKPHDEFVDVLCYACNYHLDNPFKPIDKGKLSRLVH